MPSSLLFAHPRVIAWRNRLRKNPLLRGIYTNFASRGDYEARFSRELLTALRPGDTVWDVGANIGVYAAQFAQLGAANVVCFEPAPAAIAELRRRFPENSQSPHGVRVVPVALSRCRGTVNFIADGASPNNQIGAPSSGQSNAIEIQVLSGDEALTELKLPAPNVIKIDVEGFEQEVIEGMPQLLSSKALHSVFIEVHFALLHERKLDEAPAAIVRTLGQHGFRVHWVDPSHIGARRA
jgi:FkbM family methyltransferase